MTCGSNNSNCTTFGCGNNPPLPCPLKRRIKKSSCSCCPQQNKIKCAVKRRQNVISYGPNKSISKRIIRFGGPTTITYGVDKNVKCKTINVCDWRNSPCCSCNAVNYRRQVNKNPNSVVCGEFCNTGNFCCPV